MKPGDRVWFRRAAGVVVRTYASSPTAACHDACEVFVGADNVYGMERQVDLFTRLCEPRTIDEPVDLEWTKQQRERATR